VRQSGSRRDRYGAATIGSQIFAEDTSRLGASPKLSPKKRAESSAETPPYEKNSFSQFVIFHCPTEINSDPFLCFDDFRQLKRSPNNLGAVGTAGAAPAKLLGGRRFT
jgi:hypothetical protein